MIKYLCIHALEIYFLLEHKKMDIQELYQNLVKKDHQKLEKVSSGKGNSSFLKKLKENYTKDDCLDEILYVTDSRYRHLKEIRNLVDVSHIIEEVIPDSIYLEKVKIHYTDVILDRILDTFYDMDSVHCMIDWKQELIELDSSTNRKIMKKIDEYYIKKITI